MKFTMTAAVLLAAAAVAPAAAQMAASPSPMATVPAADMKMIDKCKAMKPGAMTKNAMCAKMIKLYPDQFANTAGSNG